MTAHMVFLISKTTAVKNLIHLDKGLFLTSCSHQCLLFVHDNITVYVHTDIYVAMKTNLLFWLSCGRREALSSALWPFLSLFRWHVCFFSSIQCFGVFQRLFLRGYEFCLLFQKLRSPNDSESYLFCKEGKYDSFLFLCVQSWSARWHFSCHVCPVILYINTHFLTEGKHQTCLRCRAWNLSR